MNIFLHPFNYFFIFLSFFFKTSMIVPVLLNQHRSIDGTDSSHSQPASIFKTLGISDMLYCRGSVTQHIAQNRLGGKIEHKAKSK